MTLTNEEIAERFEQLAALLELKGEVVFKIRAYQRAARTIAQFPEPLAELVRQGKDLTAIPGIGQAIAEKTAELVTTGHMRALEQAQADLPRGVLTLMNIPGIGPKTAYRIATELHIASPEELEQAILEGKLQRLPRMSSKLAEKVLRHLQSLRTKDRRIPLGKALPAAEALMAELRERSPALQRITTAGSLRRWEETIGDIDLLCTTRDPQAVATALTSLPQVQEVLGSGTKKVSVLIYGSIQVDLRIFSEEEYGAALQYFTGSKAHNIVLREYALRMGLSLNEYGITDTATGQMERFATEEAFYARLGLPWVPPELRQGFGEVEAAREGRLPRLIEQDEIMGDLHAHSDWSDGRDPLEVMLRAARDMGYQYIAMTDHSMGRGIANGLSPERLRQQIKEIRDLERRLGIRVFCGSEVDIRADGSLDYPDEVLAELDVVVASVHSAMDQPRERITQRVIRAMEHPRVTIIGHLTTRLLGAREPADMDVEAIFQAAARTGTALEINASPFRLDLRDVHARRARELGALLAISTDAHSTEGLRDIRYGVAVARRGWCQAQHVINTMPLEAFERFLRTPKPQRAALVAGAA